MLLDELLTRGINIYIAPYNIWGKELTALIGRAKIVLNFHYYEAKVLETCRILEAISLGAMVSFLLKSWMHNLEYNNSAQKFSDGQNYCTYLQAAAITQNCNKTKMCTWGLFKQQHTKANIYTACWSPYPTWWSWTFTMLADYYWAWSGCFGEGWMGRKVGLRRKYWQCHWSCTVLHQQWRSSKTAPTSILLACISTLQIAWLSIRISLNLLQYITTIYRSDF